jgi:hypothetical protein
MRTFGALHFKTHGYDSQITRSYKSESRRRKINQKTISLLSPAKALEKLSSKGNYSWGERRNPH